MSREKTAWDNNAAYWVRIIRENHDRYRNELTDPAVLNVLGRAEGLRILDAGCGEGYLSRKMAQEGASVTGLDSSAELIKAARNHKLASELAISFDIGNVDELPYKDDTFDLILCNHLLNDLEDPTPAIVEFARVLHDNGRVVIMMLHPCFYNRHSERDELTNNLLTHTYFHTRKVTQHFEVNGLQSPVANTAWLRPLEFYTELLRRAGFVITSITEPHPSSDQIKADDWWRRSFTRPLFMLMSAQLQREIV
jgi:2-polyprenyl-3-methyl-5-hydroxy-6-metoxy-1,4-benzoquinol methylase